VGTNTSASIKYKYSSTGASLAVSRKFLRILSVFEPVLSPARIVTGLALVTVVPGVLVIEILGIRPSRFGLYVASAIGLTIVIVTLLALLTNVMLGTLGVEGPTILWHTRHRTHGRRPWSCRCVPLSRRSAHVPATQPCRTNVGHYGDPRSVRYQSSRTYYGCE